MLMSALSFTRYNSGDHLHGGRCRGQATPTVMPCQVGVHRWWPAWFTMSAQSAMACSANVRLQ